MRARSGAVLEVELLDEAAVTDGQADAGNGVGRRGFVQVCEVFDPGHGCHECNRDGRKDRCRACVDLRVVREGAAAVPVAGFVIGPGRRAIQARCRRRAGNGLVDRRRRVVVTVVCSPVLRRRRNLSRARAAAGMGHHAGNDGRLQPRDAEHAEHYPRQGAMASSNPCEAECHWAPGADWVRTVLPGTTARKQRCRRITGFAVRTYSRGTIPQ